MVCQVGVLRFPHCFEVPFAPGKALSLVRTSGISSGSHRLGRPPVSSKPRLSRFASACFGLCLAFFSVTFGSSVELFRIPCVRFCPGW